MKIGIINVMPEAEAYMPVMEAAIPGHRDLIWIRVRNHPYRSSNHTILNETHLFMEDAMALGLDGVILTGAPVDGVEFSEIWYWPELKEMLKSVYDAKIPILGLCWGAIALWKLLL